MDTVVHNSRFHPFLAYKCTCEWELPFTNCFAVPRPPAMALVNALEKGTYKAKVKLTAIANANYKAAKAKTIVFKVIIKQWVGCGARRVSA